MSRRSWRRVSCRGPGCGKVRARASRMLVMYSALKAWKARPSEMARAMAAGMAGDELIVEVDADPVRIGFEHDAAVGVARWNGIMIGVQGDAQLAGGDTGRSAGDVVGVRIERPQMLPLLREQIDGPLLRFAVDAHIGDGVEPHLCSCLNGTEVGQFDSVQEILFDVAHSRFDAPLLIATTDIARGDRKAVVAGGVVIARIEDRRGAGQALQNCRF